MLHQPNPGALEPPPVHHRNPMRLRDCAHRTGAAGNLARQVSRRHNRGGQNAAVPGGVEDEGKVLVGVAGEARVAKVVLQGFPALHPGVRHLAVKVIQMVSGCLMRGAIRVNEKQQETSFSSHLFLCKLLPKGLASSLAEKSLPSRHFTFFDKTQRMA